MGMTLGTMLSLGLWPGSLKAKESATESFRFIVINDTHYMSDECGGFLDRVVYQMKWHPGVEFCLHVGDLVEKGERAHLGAVRDIFEQLGVPVYTVPGNHDYLTAKDRTNYDQVFGKRLNYSFVHGGWQFVALDSTQGTSYEKTSVQPPTFDWLNRNVPKLDRNKPTVLFTHFPLGTNVKYRPQNADMVLDHFREVNLRAVFNGHFHGYTERGFSKATVTTNRCCALKRSNHDKTKEKGYFLCTAKDGTITREFIEVLMRPLPQPGRRVAS